MTRLVLVGSEDAEVSGAERRRRTTVEVGKTVGPVAELEAARRQIRGLGGCSARTPNRVLQ